MGHRPISSGSTPLGDLILRERQRRGLTRREFAGLLRRADRSLGTNDTQVKRWELHGNVPQKAALRALASVLEVSVERLVALAQDQSGVPVRNGTDSATASTTGTLHAEDDETRRRAFLALLATLPGLVDAERLLAVAGGPQRVDRHLLHDLQVAITHCAEQWGTVAPLSLLPAIQGHLAFLRRLLAEAQVPGLHDQICVLAAEAADQAGWLSRLLDNRGDAYRYWTLARDLAHEANKRGAVAQSLVATSSLHANGSIGALTLLDAAQTAAGPSASPHLLSWVLARQGEEHAAHGEALASGRAFEAGAAILASAPGPGTGALKHWDLPRLATWHGHCMVRLGNASDGMPLLSGALGDLDSTRLYDRSRALIELASAHSLCGRDGVEAACALLMDATAVAERGGFARHVQRIWGVRERLAPWQDAPEVKALDARLVHGGQR